MSTSFNFNLAPSASSKPYDKRSFEAVKPDNLYDVLILGGGPAGINAALYAHRKGLKVGLLTTSIGGQVVDTSSVENYLGIQNISGHDLAEAFASHLRPLSVHVSEGIEIIQYETNGDTHQLTDAQGRHFTGKTLIIATGSRPKRLNIPGESEFAGKGVAYCAICDGPLFKGKRVIVIGGGNSAVEAALDLAKIASQVTLVHRSSLRADAVLVDQLYANPKIAVQLTTVPKEIIGDQKVKGLLTQEGQFIESDGLFIEIGYTPNSQLFIDKLNANTHGELLVNEKQETSIPGVFAIGDVTNTPYKQIIVAAGEGAKAALAANDYLNHKQSI